MHNLESACSTGFTPTFQAMIPDVLPDEVQYTRALSLSRLAYDLENLLSPMMAASALLILSYDALFIGNAAAFMISAALVLSVQLPSPQPHERARGVWHNTTYGIWVYIKTPRLRGLFALSMAVAAAGAMVIVNTVVYVRDYLGGTESDTAIAFVAAGGGSMAVALVLPHILDRYPDRPFMLIGGVMLVVNLLLGLTDPGLFALLPIWFVLGAGSSLIQTPAGRLLKRSSREGDRPAVFTAQFALSHACWLLAYPLAGWLGSMFGIMEAFTVLALIALASTAVTIFMWPAEDYNELEHVHDPINHAHLHIHDEHHQHNHEGWEAPEPHSHPHRHSRMKHKHPFVIDLHHQIWPQH